MPPNILKALIYLTVPCTKFRSNSPRLLEKNLFSARVGSWLDLTILRVPSNPNDPVTPKRCQATRQLSGMMKQPHAKDEFLLLKRVNQRMKLQQCRGLVAIAVS